MAKKPDKPGKPAEPAKAEEPARRDPLIAGNNPLAEIDDGLLKNYQRHSNELIWESVMRGGGEPFGAPFEAHVSTLTEKLVRLFKQHSFFGFETLEKGRRRNRRNRFTRYGASPFRGTYRPPKTKPR